MLSGEHRNYDHVNDGPTSVHPSIPTPPPPTVHSIFIHPTLLLMTDKGYTYSLSSSIRCSFTVISVRRLASCWWWTYMCASIYSHPTPTQVYSIFIHPTLLLMKDTCKGYTYSLSSSIMCSFTEISVRRLASWWWWTYMCASIYSHPTPIQVYLIFIRPTLLLMTDKGYTYSLSSSIMCSFTVISVRRLASCWWWTYMCASIYSHPTPPRYIQSLSTPPSSSWKIHVKGIHTPWVPQSCVPSLRSLCVGWPTVGDGPTCVLPSIPTPPPLRYIQSLSTPPSSSWKIKGIHTPWVPQSCFLSLRSLCVGWPAVGDGPTGVLSSIPTPPPPRYIQSLSTPPSSSWKIKGILYILLEFLNHVFLHWDLCA